MAAEGGLRQVPEPGGALRHGRCVRGPRGERQSPRGAYRSAVGRRVPLAGGGGGLAAAFIADGLRDVRLSLDGLAEDLFADAAYRGHLAGVLARRAVALANAPGSGVEVFSQGSPQRRG